MNSQSFSAWFSVKEYGSLRLRTKEDWYWLQRIGLSCWNLDMARMVETRCWQSVRLGMMEGGGGGFWHMGTERESGRVARRIDSTANILYVRFVDEDNCVSIECADCSI